MNDQAATVVVAKLYSSNKVWHQKMKSQGDILKQNEVLALLNNEVNPSSDGVNEDTSQT